MLDLSDSFASFFDFPTFSLMCLEFFRARLTIILRRDLRDFPPKEKLAASFHVNPHHLLQN